MRVVSAGLTLMALWRAVDSAQNGNYTGCAYLVLYVIAGYSVASIGIRAMLAMEPLIAETLREQQAIAEAAVMLSLGESSARLAEDIGECIKTGRRLEAKRPMVQVCADHLLVLLTLTKLAYFVFTLPFTRKHVLKMFQTVVRDIPATRVLPNELAMLATSLFAGWAVSDYFADMFPPSLESEGPEGRFWKMAGGDGDVPTGLHPFDIVPRPQNRFGLGYIKKACGRLRGYFRAARDPSSVFFDFLNEHKVAIVATVLTLLALCIVLFATRIQRILEKGDALDKHIATKKAGRKAVHKDLRKGPTAKKPGDKTIDWIKLYPNEDDDDLYDIFYNSDGEVRAYRGVTKAMMYERVQDIDYDEVTYYTRGGVAYTSDDMFAYDDFDDMERDHYRYMQSINPDVSAADAYLLQVVMAEITEKPLGKLEALVRRPKLGVSEDRVVEVSRALREINKDMKTYFRKIGRNADCEVLERIVKGFRQLVEGDSEWEKTLPIENLTDSTLDVARKICSNAASLARNKRKAQEQSQEESEPPKVEVTPPAVTDTIAPASAPPQQHPLRVADVEAVAGPRPRKASKGADGAGPSRDNPALHRKGEPKPAKASGPSSVSSRPAAVAPLSAVPSRLSKEAKPAKVESARAITPAELSLVHVRTPNGKAHGIVVGSDIEFPAHIAVLNASDASGKDLPPFEVEVSTDGMTFYKAGLASLFAYDRARVAKPKELNNMTKCRVPFLPPGINASGSAAFMVTKRGSQCAFSGATSLRRVVEDKKGWGKISYYSYTADTEPGDCGAPIVAHVGGKNHIIGFHMWAMDGKSNSTKQAVTTESLSRTADEILLDATIAANKKTESGNGKGLKAKP